LLVRVLLDENLPYDLAQALAKHEVVTVQGLGWSGLKNGELLRRADGHIDAFITMDSNLQFQQRLEELPFGVIVIHARSNRMADLRPIVELVLAALAGAAPGVVRHVGS
jgi:predicted nuclease of predicted toxin-antitoxin system